jgi:hypothetical protein
VGGQPLEVIRAPQVRALWNKRLRPVLKELGFKAGKFSPGAWNGWERQSADLRMFFWFQLFRYGFDRYQGGRFILEFVGNDLPRKVGLRDRMWSVMDDASRREVVRINNEVIASLPGPSTETLGWLPETLRPTYLDDFKRIEAIPSAQDDVWFRYATMADVAGWGEFIATRLPSLIAGYEERLKSTQAGTSMISGYVMKASTESDGSDETQ